MKKFIVLVICALIGMLSIPHITLWNFSVGSETVNAETTIGASCTESGKYSCSASSGQYVISSCIRGAWARWSGSTYPSLDACKAACNSGTYASNCIESPAVEPQYTLTNSISPSQPVIGSPLVIFSKVTSGSIQTNQIESHKIIWKVVKGSQTVVSETTNMCSTSYTDCQITISSSVPDSWNGATLNYRSEMKLYGGFTKLAPASGDDSVTIGSIQTPPNNKAQCPLPDTASVITCNTNQDCSNKINDCFIKSDSDLEYIAPACVSGKCKTIIGWAWTCTNGFDNNRCSGDAACLKFVSSAGFSNPYPEGKTFQQCSPGSAPPTSGTNTLNIQPTFYTIPTGTTYNFVAQGLASTDSIQLSGITFDNPAVASVSGINVKTITVRGNAVGTAAMTVTSSDSKTGTVNIAVGTGSGTSTSTNHCCIKKSGSSYTYENINPFQSTLCTELGNTYRPEPCVNAQNYACAQYCLDGGLGNNGNCNNLGNPTSPYYGICLNPTATPCVCSGPPSNANLPCESLCNTDSRVISVVNSAYSAQQIISASCQCTTNPSATNVMVQLPTAGSASNRQPIQLGMAGQNGCTNPQACWATFMTLASYSATTQTAATLPGTQTAGTWTHPNDVTASAPETTPNDYDCTLAGNATITASLGIAGTTQTSGTSSTSVSRLIQAGETVTITGKVTKMADNCKGYKYTCIRMSQKIACESKNRGLWTSLDYKTCPSDLPEVVHAEGEGTSMNWKLITTAALVIAASIASAGSATAGIAGFLASQKSSLILTAVIATTENLNCRPGTSQSGSQQAIAMGTNIALQLAQCAGGGTTAAAATAAGGAAAGAAAGGQVNCAQFTTSMECIDPRCAWSSSTMTCVSAGQTTGGTTGQQITNAACISCIGQGKTWCQTSGCKSSSSECGTERFTQISEGCSGMPLTGAATTKSTFDVTGDATANPAPGITGMAGCSFTSSQLSGAGLSLALSALPTCPSADDYMNCFSVCGKTYETPVAAAPLCNQGGPVIGFTAATYPCATGTCGAYANKRVKIDIRGPDGSQAIEDYVTTDSLGDFSYTFQAPAADGEFTAIVSVPRS